MAKPLITNNAYSTLAGSINPGDTTLTVASGEGSRFPAATTGGDYFYATLINASNELEIVKVTNRTADSFTIVRAQDGTSARGYSNGNRIELRPVAALFGDIRDSERTPLDASVTTAKIVDDAVTLAKMEPMSVDGFIGNDAGSIATPQHLTVSEATAALNAVVGDSGSGGTKGLVPAPSANDGDSDKMKFLAANGSFKVPGWQFIEEVSGDGSSAYLASTVDLSDFDLVRITAIVVPSVSAALTMQFATSGPSWITTSSYLTYSVHVDHNTSGGGADAAGSVGTGTGIFISRNGAWFLDAAPSMDYSGMFHMSGLKAGAWVNVFAGESYYSSSGSSGLVELREFSANLQNTSAITNLRLVLSTGVFQSGSHLLVEGFRFG